MNDSTGQLRNLSLAPLSDRTVEPLRVLWIGKNAEGDGGDEVFDRKMIAACRTLGHEVICCHPVRVSKLKEVVNLVGRGIPHYRTWYESNENHALIRPLMPKVDVAVCSWEPLDGLAFRMRAPVVPILHNLTSRAVGRMFPRSMLARMVRRRAAKWESLVYRSDHFLAIATLGVDDFAYLQAKVPGANVILTPPGAPPMSELADDARVDAVLTISGTYDWYPKRRDLLAFAKEYAQLTKPLPVHAADLPPEARQLLRVRPKLCDSDVSRHVRFGLITDRFEAGFKLKTLAYIAQNAIVISYADVTADFSGIPDSTLFIQNVRRVADIERVTMAFVAMDPAELRRRFVRFKAACAERFSWRSSAQTLLRAAKARL